MPVEVAEREVELEAREVRVVGCLIEKELSTPDYYPMTVNALASACNQKTNREPVVNYSEEDVAEALEGLQRKRLVGSASSSYGRAAKYRHALAEMMDLNEAQLSVLASLMLRGPETAGEVRARTGRMYEFDSLDAVDAVLDGLSSGKMPLVTELPRRPGQKEVRYAHMFSGEVDETADTTSSATGDDRIDALEAEVAELKTALDALDDAFRAFKNQFE